MKKCLVVLTGITALMLLFVPAASASYILCGAATSGGDGATALGATQPVTFTCPSIAIPTGSWLTGFTIELVDDAQGPIGAGVSVNWTWNGFTGIPTGSLLGAQINSEQANSSGTSFNGCTVTLAAQASDGCNPTVLSFTEPNLTGTFNAVSAGVTAAPENIFQLNVCGDSASMYIQYNYGTGVPEPATMSLIGGALLGLGMFGFKRFSRQ